MRVTVDYKRILHLIVLILLTYIFGQILVQRYDWAPLSAYGLTCSLVCQISNVILKFHEISNSLMPKDKDKDEERTEKKEGKARSRKDRKASKKGKIKIVR